MRMPKPALLAMVVVLVLTGCVHQPRPGLAVRALQSDIAFGFHTRPLAVPPTADLTPQELAGAQQGSVPETSSPTRTRRVVPTVPPARQTLCPPAAEGAFPAQAATFSVPGPPAAGRYRWKETVEEPVGSGQTVKTITFFNHDIVNVSPVTQTPNPVPAGAGQVLGSPTAPVRTFTYDEVIHNLDGSTTTTTYQVKENQAQLNADPTVGTNVQQGPPDRGLALVKTVHTSADGRTVSTFAPVSPVLLLPLDVVTPQQFQSSGTAPDGSSLTVNGTVVKRARVDACGTVIDGWEVDSTQVFTPADPSQQAVPVTDTYYVATQIGGLITYENKTLPDQLRTATTPTVIDSIAQLTPDPIGSR